MASTRQELVLRSVRFIVQFLLLLLLNCADHTTSRRQKGHDRDSCHCHTTVGKTQRVSKVFYCDNEVRMRNEKEQVNIIQFE